MPLTVDNRVEQIQGEQKYTLNCIGGCNGTRHIQLNTLTGAVVDSPIKVASVVYDKTYSYQINIGQDSRWWAPRIATTHGIIAHGKGSFGGLEGDQITVQV